LDLRIVRAISANISLARRVNAVLFRPHFRNRIAFPRDASHLSA